MRKVNLRIWIILQAIVTMTMPVYVLGIVKKAKPEMLVLMLVLVSFLETLFNRRIKQNLDERAAEIWNGIRNKICGVYEILCVYAGVAVLLLLCRYDWNSPADLSIVQSRLKIVALCLVFALPVLDIVFAAMFAVRDRR